MFAMEPYPTEVVFMFFDSLESSDESLWNLYLCSRDTQALLIGWVRARRGTAPGFIRGCLRYGFIEGLSARARIRPESAGKVSIRGIKYIGVGLLNVVWLLDEYGPEALRWYARMVPDHTELDNLGISFLVENGTPHRHSNLNEALRWNYRILEVAEVTRKNDSIFTASTWNPEVPDETYLAISDRLYLPSIIRGATRSGRMELALRLWPLMSFDRRNWMVDHMLRDDCELAIEFCKLSPDMGVEWFMGKISVSDPDTERRVREAFAR